MTRKSPLSVSGEEKFIDKTVPNGQRKAPSPHEKTANEAVGHKPSRYRVDSLAGIGELLFNPENPSFPSGGSGGLVAIGVAQDAVANALVVTGQPQRGQPCLPLGLIEGLARTVDPTAAHSQCVSGQHEIAHDQGAVVDMGSSSLLGQHNQHHGRAVEGIPVRAHHGGIGAGETVAGILIGDGNNNGVLGIHAAGGVEAGLDDLVDDLTGEHVGFILADGAAGEDGLDGGVQGGLLSALDDNIVTKRGKLSR